MGMGRRVGVGAGRLALGVLCLTMAWPVRATAFEVVRIVSGLSQPLFVTTPPGETGRLFIVQKGGAIRILDRTDDTILATPFLTLPVTTNSERGLLGLAFHPDYAVNGFFYVYYTDSGGDTQISRFSVSANPNLADAGSEVPILDFEQPQSNHNGGWIGFGLLDGYLYIASGDGGSGNDSGTGHTPGVGNGQDPTDNLLGKILRIDVDGDDFPSDATLNYAVPATNPFVGVSGDDEIWAWGLRNPWRVSFDRVTGDLYIGDVGQGEREEISVQPATSTGGENYGWRLREGTIAPPGVGGPKPAGAIDPIYDYTRGGGAFQGNSVTGGYVYRGPATDVYGHYFFADFATSRIWSLIWDGSDPSTHDGTNFTNLEDRTAQMAPDVGSIGSIASFGEDGVGNLFVVDLGGEVFELVPSPPVDCPATVDTGCIGGFERASLLVREIPGKKRLVARWLRGPELDQADLGDPLAPGGTSYDLCIYDEAGDRVDAAAIKIDRAGDLCGNAPCWRDLGGLPPDGKGYKFRDRAGDSAGMRVLVYRGSVGGRSRLVVRGAGGLVPSGITTALAGDSSATIQLRASNAECLSATVGEVVRDDAQVFKAK